MEKWQKPNLTILVRGTPEERILAVCKGDNSTSNPIDTNTDCRSSGCSLCSEVATS